MLGGVLFGQRFEGVGFGVLDVVDDEVDMDEDVVVASDVDGEVLLEIGVVVVEAVNEEVVDISWVDDVVGRPSVDVEPVTEILDVIVVIDEVDEPAAAPGIS